MDFSSRTIGILAKSKNYTVREMSDRIRASTGKSLRELSCDEYLQAWFKLPKGNGSYDPDLLERQMINQVLRSVRRAS